jgi:hypothetical protein
MRLKESQVKFICQNVLVTLRSKQLITLNKSDSEILSKMEGIFLAELRIEDDINKEAERLLDYAIRQSGNNSNVDREKMFQMIKKQLLKDKKVVT